MHAPRWLQALTAVIFPAECGVCGTTLAPGERIMCLQCLAELPRTGIHVADFNEIHRRTAHKTHIEHAGAYFHYERHSPYSTLIHQAKYNNRPDLAEDLAESYAREIMPSGFFDGIDIIEPVPLHWLKRLTRGYNQSYHIAIGISRATGLPIGDHLDVARYQRSQTRRNRAGRHAATEGLYRAVNADELTGHHALIVDDVITTGSTIAACCRTLTSATPDLRLSLLSLGLSRKG